MEQKIKQLETLIIKLRAKDYTVHCVNYSTYSTISVLKGIYKFSKIIQESNIDNILTELQNELDRANV